MLSPSALELKVDAQCTIIKNTETEKWDIRNLALLEIKNLVKFKYYITNF